LTTANKKVLLANLPSQHLLSGRILVSCPFVGGYLAAPEDLEAWQAIADEGVEESEGNLLLMMSTNCLLHLHLR